MIAQELRDKYVAHILSWEGLKSKDPRDTAATCAPFKGAYHTNRGITFCTFRKYALSVGIARTYERFLVMSEADVSKFVQIFVDAAGASALPDRVALSVTEAAWGSGPSRAIKHLQDAINALGGRLVADGVNGKGTTKAALALPEPTLYEEYWRQRQKYLNYLTSKPAYAMWKNGWNNRIKGFRAIFG